MDFVFNSDDKVSKFITIKFKDYYFFQQNQYSYSKQIMLQLPYFPHHKASLLIITSEYCTLYTAYFTLGTNQGTHLHYNSAAFNIYLDMYLIRVAVFFIIQQMILDFVESFKFRPIKQPFRCFMQMPKWKPISFNLKKKSKSNQRFSKIMQIQTPQTQQKSCFTQTPQEIIKQSQQVKRFKFFDLIFPQI
eukprot:TRINITY_DN7938_c1_g1_i1.p2 TRINITY_DN7938_c1_g1~~TRINITY_DN7938_c1_g1_i1.p2  ORF type:complete len:190 (-),score=-11.28 TRINITY_DN7938_c1_g1_i1:90-659(-)